MPKQAGCSAEGEEVEGAIAPDPWVLHKWAMDYLSSVYAGSDLVTQAVEHRTLSFVDVDGTIAGYAEEPSWKEIEARREIREILDKETGLTLSTMRTPELCMSERAYEASCAVGFERKRPNCHRDTAGNRLVYKSLTSLLRYTHNLDPDCISNPGTGIWVRCDGAYRQDRTFFDRHQIDCAKWRADVDKLLQEVDPDRAIRNTFSSLEDPASYESGSADVETLACRYELRFKGIEGAAGWKEFVWDRLHSLPTNHPLSKVAQRIDIIDESVPVLNRTQIYLVPHRRFTKEGATNHIVSMVSQVSGIPTQELTTITIGDRMPDLKAGLMSGYNTRGFFVLAGGSPLTEYLVGDKKGEAFAGQSLKSIVRRLKPLGRKGFYTFQMFGMPSLRVVVICDEAFPGMTDAESVYQFLKLFRQ